MPHKDKETRAEYQRRRYREDPEVRRRHNECQERWNEKNRERRLKYNREWALSNREKWYAIHRRSERKKLLSKYGVDEAWHAAKCVEQNNLCAVCGNHETRRHHARDQQLFQLSVDHDHLTGKVRGLLCQRCNRQLHALEDSGWFVKANQYLKKYEGISTV